MAAKCFECRAGEHDDEDDDIRMCLITLDGERARRGNLCGHHRCIMEEDGYTVTILR
jgi:hypothetical protein